jgi:hypothetical protein
MHDSGAKASREYGSVSLRGAERRGNPVFRRRILDCFAEPVIGRAFARPVGSNDEFRTVGYLTCEQEILGNQLAHRARRR